MCGGDIFGRDVEQETIGAFLHAVRESAVALVLAGPPGSGKTTLLRASSERAVASSYQVLATTPARADARLAFAGLADLAEPYIDSVIGDLPPPQAEALSVALLRTQAPPEPPDPRLIATAFRAFLIALARSAPALVLIDDLQWLDPPSATAVSFAMRRIDNMRVGLLCGYRTDEPGAVPPMELGRGRLAAEVLPLGGLSIGALHRLLRLRLGVSFARPTLRRIEHESGGNPFIALEMGRALVRRGIRSTHFSAMPIPATLSGLVSERIGELPRAVRDGLQLVAVMPDVTPDKYLAGGVGEAELDAAVEAGVLEPDDGRLRFSHPLLRAAVVASIPPGRLRTLHEVAARLAVDTEDRARHLAHAAKEPSATVAADVEAAARTAAGRGAPATAGELFELAASLTPDTDQADLSRRIADAARHLAMGGERHAAIAVLERFISASPTGPRRADVLTQLGWLLREDDSARATALLEQALAEARDDPAKAADIRLALSDIAAKLGDHRRAISVARLALAAAEKAASAPLIAGAIGTLALARLQGGQPADPMQLQRALDIEQQVGLGAIANNGYLPSYAAGQSCRLDGRLEDAEAHWARLLGSCRTAGLEFWRADALMRLSLLALCRGDLSAGGALSAEGLERAEQFGHPPTIAALLWVCGEVAALQGRVDEARGFAERGMAEAAAISGITFKLRNEALLGTVDLALGNFRASADRLAPLAISWRSHCARFLVHNGIDVQAVEALIGAGDLAKAERLIEDMAGNAYSILGAAIIAGCRGHLAAARGELHSAVAQLTHALDLHEQISPHPLARAQVLLVLGGVQLRLKERALARATLSAALSVFECAGAPLLAERARAVLGRISGRAAGTAELTTTEMRVAELVASGRTNKEAAAELFVSVRAIESTLTKAYAKLGVRSRTELAARLQQLSQPTPRRTVVATELSS